MSSITFSTSKREHKADELADRPGWATPEELARFSSGDPTADIILAQGATMSFDRPVPFEDRRNYNSLFIGGSGSGKSNVLMANLANHLPANFAITDSKGELFRTTSAGYRADGYEVLRLDTIDLSQSCHFSPLAYLYTDEDVVTIGQMIMDGINPNRYVTKDVFWERSSELLAYALIGILLTMERLDGVFKDGARPADSYRRYLTFENFFMLQDLIKITDEDSSGSDMVSPLDRVVNTIANGGTVSGPDGSTWELEPQPDSCGVRYYRAFRTAARRTLKSILITFHATFAAVRTPEMMRVLSGDDLRLDQIDEGKRILYFVMSDNDSSYSWLGNLAYKLLVNRALRKADANPDGRLARPVLFLCDEFANLGRIPDFERAISIARSRRMGFMLFIQSFEQVDVAYGAGGQGRDIREIILDNCDALVFLGGGSALHTAEYLSDLCGPAAPGSRKRLIEPSEASQLPRTQCVVKISGARPFLAAKYDAHTHPNAARYLELSE